MEIPGFGTLCLAGIVARRVPRSGLRSQLSHRFFEGACMPSREEAVSLLEAWVENENLRKHMLAVEAAVRRYAQLRGADEETWGYAGLLHDLDWEKHPEEH